MGRMEDHSGDYRDSVGQSPHVPGGAAEIAHNGGWQEAMDAMTPLERHDWKARQLANLALARAGHATDGEAGTDISGVQLPETGAFGAFVKPEQYDPFKEYDFDSLEPRERDWLTPQKLRQLLFHPPADASFSVWRSDYQAGQRGEQVALPAAEYTLLARSPLALAKAIEARSIDSKPVTEATLTDSADKTIEELVAKRAAMQEHADALDGVVADLKALREAQEQPGRATRNRYEHATGKPRGNRTSVEMAQLTSVAWNEFMLMLDVVQTQRGWDDDQRQKAETAMAAYLTQGKQSERTNHWQNMTNLARDYATLRSVVFKNRIARLDAILEPAADTEPISA